jgi:hypothetical protein
MIYALDFYSKNSNQIEIILQMDQPISIELVFCVMELL